MRATCWAVMARLPWLSQGSNLAEELLLGGTASFGMDAPHARRETDQEGHPTSAASCSVPRSPQLERPLRRAARKHCRQALPKLTSKRIVVDWPTTSTCWTNRAAPVQHAPMLARRHGARPGALRGVEGRGESGVAPSRRDRGAQPAVQRCPWSGWHRRLCSRSAANRVRRMEGHTARPRPPRCRVRRVLAGRARPQPVDHDTQFPWWCRCTETRSWNGSALPTSRHAALAGAETGRAATARGAPDDQELAAAVPARAHRFPASRRGPRIIDWLAALGFVKRAGPPLRLAHPRRSRRHRAP